MKTANTSQSLIILSAIIAALVLGKNLLIPFLFAVLFYFLIRAIRRLMDRSAFIKNKLPSWLKNSVSAVFIFSLLAITVQFIVINSEQLASSFPRYQPNIDKMVQSLNGLTGRNLSREIAEKMSSISVAPFINELLGALSSFMGNFAMMLFYMLFLFLEEAIFKTKLHLIVPKKEEFESMKKLLINIESSITHYIGLKTFVSVLSAIVCYITLLSFGINSPLFWSFLVFVLNFIPIIGALLVVALPVLFAFIQFGEISLPLILFVVHFTLQTVIANVIEPKLMGNSLNISPLVALIALSFWGAIWGISGMIVSVPITVIVIILLAQFPSTKSIAIMMSANGKV